jgi:hypothetical protein
LPATLELLQNSARLGCEVATLLEPQSAVLGVTTGKLRREISLLGRITGPKIGFNLWVTAGWGHIQKNKGVVMPGRGLSKNRDFSDQENSAITDGSDDLGLSNEAIKGLWAVRPLIFT